MVFPHLVRFNIASDSLRASRRDAKKKKTLVRLKSHFRTASMENTMSHRYQPVSGARPIVSLADLFREALHELIPEKQPPLPPFRMFGGSAAASVARPVATFASLALPPNQAARAAAQAAANIANLPLPPQVKILTEVSLLAMLVILSLGPRGQPPVFGNNSPGWSIHSPAPPHLMPQSASTGGNMMPETSYQPVGGVWNHVYGPFPYPIGFGAWADKWFSVPPAEWFWPPRPLHGGYAQPMPGRKPYESWSPAIRPGSRINIRPQPQPVPDPIPEPPVTVINPQPQTINDPLVNPAPIARPQTRPLPRNFPSWATHGIEISVSRANGRIQSRRTPDRKKRNPRQERKTKVPSGVAGWVAGGLGAIEIMSEAWDMVEAIWNGLDLPGNPGIWRKFEIIFLNDFVHKTGLNGWRGNNYKLSMKDIWDARGGLAREIVKEWALDKMYGRAHGYMKPRTNVESGARSAVRHLNQIGGML